MAHTNINNNLINVRRVTLDGHMSGSELQMIFTGTSGTAGVANTMELNILRGSYRDGIKTFNSVTLSNYATLLNKSSTDIRFETNTTGHPTIFYHRIIVQNYDKTPRVQRAGTGNRDGGILECRRNIRHSFIKVGGGLTNPLVYSIESDNGYRTSFTTTDEPTLPASINYLPTLKTLVKSTSSQADLDALTQVIWNRFNIDIGNANVRIDKRYNTNDTIDYHMWSYDCEYFVSNVNYIGLNTLNNIVYMLPDTKVTMSEEDALLKLASSLSITRATNLANILLASTLDDLYDMIKAYKTENVLEQVEYPSISTMPITVTGTTIISNGMSFTNTHRLTKGSKFDTLNATNISMSGAFSNINLVGTVTQNTPTDLTNVNITGTLVYNTNSNISVTFTNCTVGTVRNDGTGLVSIVPVGNVVITNFSDPQINFIDSNFTITGVDSVRIYNTSEDRDLNNNPGPLVVGSLPFKYNSVIDGVTMGGTRYLRVYAPPVTIFAEITFSAGSNSLDLGVTGQLAIIGGKLDNRPTLAQIEQSNILAKEKTVKLSAALSA